MKDDRRRKLPLIGEGDEKTLMPEVLPEPPAPVGPSSPRQRTVGHMRKILAAAAALGVAATTGRARVANANPGADPPPPPPDAATNDATADGADDGSAADAVSDGPQDTGLNFVYDARPGMDPAPPPPDANGPDGHMNPGFDPNGPPGTENNQNAGCSCDVVGKPGR